MDIKVFFLFLVTYYCEFKNDLSVVMFYLIIYIFFKNYYILILHNHFFFAILQQLNTDIHMYNRGLDSFLQI